MKKLGLLVVLVTLSLPAIAKADDLIYQCLATGDLYESPFIDSYTFCMNNCFGSNGPNNCVIWPPPGTCVGCDPGDIDIDTGNDDSPWGDSF